MSLVTIEKRLFAALIACIALSGAASAETWTADNGDGTFSNPLFYDEFSDPDLIRVGDDFYLTGTTMHSMPGLPVLHSRDLVNWTFLSYAAETLDLGPAFRLEEGKAIYGQGVWAPAFRYHDGTFHIFSNVNGHTTQHYSARNPRGPWKHESMRRALYDLSVLFDDDGKIYAVYGYQEIRLAELNKELTDIVPGTERVIITKDAGMGEGLHFYKFGKKYFIISAEWNGMRMPAARADSVTGPWEVNRAISVDEDFGLVKGYRANGKQPPFQIAPPDPKLRGWGSLHQGGIVQTPAGEWWGFSMYDANSIGRLTGLSPITWKDGWPYFGLPGNLTRTPRTWVKPKTSVSSTPHAPYQRNDDFSAKQLQPVWQWNHVPVKNKWSLTERPGFLRLHSMAAPDFLAARNTLTQRAMGPESTATVLLETDGLKPGDVAGFALLTRPYGWIGVERKGDALYVTRFDEQLGGKINEMRSALVHTKRIWLRAECDFFTERQRLSYSTDGVEFKQLGEDFITAYQLITFQGVRYSMFSFNSAGREGGYADFDFMKIDEPRPRGRQAIPYGKQVTFRPLVPDSVPALINAPFTIVDRGLGRVSLKRGDAVLTVRERGQVELAKATDDEGQEFQWIDTLTGEVTLLSLKTHRFLRVDKTTLVADSPGPVPDGKDGTRFTSLVGQ